MLTLASLADVWKANLLSPYILFFFLGVGAALIRSDLRIPKAFARTMALYLLFTIGFKGGLELAKSGFTKESMMAITAAIVLSTLTPLYIFPLLKKKLGQATAAGVAATYGSVSAVTFIAAVSLLQQRDLAYGGHMVAAMAAMEFPALIVGVMLARLGASALEPTDHTAGTAPAKPHGLGSVLRESVTNGSIVLLMGSMFVGFITDSKNAALTQPLWKDLFYGILCFYLLDLGLIAGRNIKQLLKAGPFVIAMGFIIPPVNAAIGLALAKLAGLLHGDGFLLTVMAASASYIAAPAALRIAVPEAKASIYVPMALTLTFPFNIMLGLPVYWSVCEWAWR
ncbi:MAG TPA: sodium-dependent bicarbonate transport family permease [Phycisphaerales bacterium]|nr:sodium-dependent bicarbonate transport family permease [Phycisphaerales bacterium]